MGAFISMSAAPSAETRQDHGAVMDEVYRPQRHVYDFTRKYYILGRDALIRDLSLRPGESLVEIGCGTHAALGDKGCLHVVDFGDLGGLPPSAARLLRAWLGRFQVTPRAELLHEIESGIRPAERLTLLPGRYAFRYRQRLSFGKEG